MKIIPLDGSLKSDLNWTVPELSPDDQVMWTLDLGLFDRLPFPLSHESQLKSLMLSLNHFADAVWPFVCQNSRGVCLYSGSLDVSGQMWNDDHEQGFLRWCREVHCRSEDPFMRKIYARDLAADYLNLLVGSLPDDIPAFLLFDAGDTPDPFHAMCLLDPERTERFHRAVKNSAVQTRDLIWDDALSEPPAASVGVYLPHSETYEECSQEAFRHALIGLEQMQLSYRIIAEDHLIRDWDGLDVLLVDPGSVSPFGKRKIMGFSAAGGTIVTLNSSDLAVPELVTFDDFIQNAHSFLET